MIIETIDEDNVEVMTNFSDEGDDDYQQFAEDNEQIYDNEEIYNEEEYNEIYNDDDEGNKKYYENNKKDDDIEQEDGNYVEDNQTDKDNINNKNDRNNNGSGEDRGGRRNESVKRNDDSNSQGILVSDILNEEQTLIKLCAELWDKKYESLNEEQKTIVDAIIVSSYSDKEILNNFPNLFKPHTVGWEIRYCKMDDSFERIANPNCILKHNTRPQYSVFIQEKHGIRQIYKIDNLDTAIIAVKNDSKFQPTKGELEFFAKNGIKKFIPIKETKDGNYIKRKEINIENVKPRIDDEGNMLMKILLIFLVILLVLVTVLIGYITIKG